MEGKDMNDKSGLVSDNVWGGAMVTVKHTIPLAEAADMVNEVVDAVCEADDSFSLTYHAAEEDFIIWKAYVTHFTTYDVAGTDDEDLYRMFLIWDWKIALYDYINENQKSSLDFAIARAIEHRLDEWRSEAKAEVARVAAQIEEIASVFSRLTDQMKDVDMKEVVGNIRALSEQGIRLDPRV